MKTELDALKLANSMDLMDELASRYDAFVCAGLRPVDGEEVSTGLRPDNGHVTYRFHGSTFNVSGLMGVIQEAMFTEQEEDEE